MKIRKVLQICSAIVFITGLIINTVFDPLLLISDKAIASTTTATSTTSSLICTASVDCDLVTGGGYVKCYNYNPEGTCESYPLLHKVVCDGHASYCENK